MADSIPSSSSSYLGGGLPSSPSSSSSSPPSSTLFHSVVDFFFRLFWSSGLKDIAFSSDMMLNRSSADLPVYPSTSVLNIDKDVRGMSYFYANFETSFHAGDTMVLNRTYYGIGLTTVVAYLLFIYLGPKIMKNRKPFDLQTPLKYWNLLLAVFSFCGTIRVVPHLFLVLYKLGFVASICSPPVYVYGHGAAGLWVLLFTYSKYVELIDTVFIVLRKKELGFLHWYHHSTVLLYTWDAYCVEQPCGIYFVSMNYSVHSIMYLYFYLTAQTKKRLSWGIFVTIAQIAQMFVGVGVTMVSLYYTQAYPNQATWAAEQVADPLKHGVYISQGNLIGGMLMYSTYFYLFAKFFFNRYHSAPSPPPTPSPSSSTPQKTIMAVASKSTDDGGSTYCSTSELSEEDNRGAAIAVQRSASKSRNNGTTEGATVRKRHGVVSK
eukprot:GHVS01108176.1.p1 GENE.GHVS01108176.1~~GHVS01108176.1.p1  ORF type:complete len:434 (+),score=94.40 GHVS01108176.1:192-1493(+)